MRGDALSASLDADQPKTADRWYIRRWDDQSSTLAGAMRIASANNLAANSSLSVPVTFGALKASYLK